MKILLHQHPDQYLLKTLAQNFAVQLTDLFKPHDFDPKNYVVFLDIAQTETIHNYSSKGYKIIVSKFYDEQLDDPLGTYIDNNCLYLYCRDWCWINTASIYIFAKHNYIRLESQPDKFFLMMMNLQRAHRDQLFEITQPYHTDSLYSYVEQGYYLPNDAPRSTTKRGISDQHRYNPEWYAQTMFSMVAEARVRWPAKSATARFVTEKTFKPIAFQHPFVVYGTHGTLSYLHKHGFETFGHAIDESYDSIIQYEPRLEAIDKILKKLYNEYKQGKKLFADSVSKEKILHNYHNFYNAAKLNQMWTEQIINPIREFLNA